MGKTMAYLGAGTEMALLIKKPFEGNVFCLAQAVCFLLLVAGILVFKNNLNR